MGIAVRMQRICSKMLMNKKINENLKKVLRKIDRKLLV